MTELVLSVKLTGDSSGLTGSVKISREEIKQLGSQLDKAGSSNDRFSRGLQQTEKRATGAGVAIKRAAHYLVGWAAIQKAREILTLVDSYHTLEKRIESATRISGNYLVVSEQIHQISRDNGAAIESTTSLFQGLSRVRNELSATDEDLLSLSNALQQAGAIGGSSTAAMQAGMMQFTQAMASGTVRAEEMNSIVENMPEVAVRIANGMHTTVGQLQMAVREGKVLSKDVFEALLQQAPEIAAEFEQLGLNLARGGEKFEQSITAALAKLDDAVGVTGNLAQVLSESADQINIAAGNAGLKDLARDVERLRELRNDGSHDATGIAGLFGANRAWLEKTIAEREAAVRQKLIEQDPRYRIQYLEDEIASHQGRLERNPNGLNSRAVSAQIERLTTQLADAQKRLELVELGPDTAIGKPVDAKNAEKIKEYINALKEEQALYGASAAEIAAYEVKKLGADAATQQLAASLTGQIEAEKALDAELDEAIKQQDEMEAAYAKRMESNQSVIQALEQELELAKMSDAERAVEIELRKLSSDATDEQIDRVRELSEANYEQAEAAKEAQKQQRELAKENERAMRRIEYATNRSMQAAEDAFVKFAKTGKFEFKDLINVMLEEMIRLQFRQQYEGAASSVFGSIFGGFSDIFGGGTQQSQMLNDQWGVFDEIGSFFGFGTGGIMTKFGPLQLEKYGTGGVVNSPSFRVAGERYQPEAVIPLPDGRSVPVNLQGGGASGGMVFSPTYNIDAKGATPGMDGRIKQIARQVAEDSLNNFRRSIRNGGSDAALVGRRR